jgi:hypothetical protein
MRVMYVSTSPYEIFRGNRTTGVCHAGWKQRKIPRVKEGYKIYFYSFFASAGAHEAPYSKSEIREPFDQMAKGGVRGWGLSTDARANDT